MPKTKQGSAQRRCSASISRKIPNPPPAAGPRPLPRRGPRPLPCYAAGVPLPPSPQRLDSPKTPRAPTPSEAQGSTERCGPDVPKAQSMGATQRWAAGTAGKRRKAQHGGLNPPKNPEPAPLAWARPLPCHAASAPLPASP